MKRRQFVRNTILTGTALYSIPSMANLMDGDFKVNAITSGQVQHWFGYYDKWQVNASGRYALGMQVDHIYRSPSKEDVLKIGLIDLQDGNKWREIGQTTAWGWQQGCMLQWLPGSDDEVIWNARLENGFVSIIYNVKTGQRRIIPKAIYTLSPDGKTAIGTDFVRIDHMRVGYGYAGGYDPAYNEKAPDDMGIYKIDLSTGKTDLIISYKQISEISHNGVDISDKFHYFNHLLISPDGKRFIFLNRYRDFTMSPEMRADPDANKKYVSGKYTTRMFTASLKDGGDVYELDQSGRTSHFIWRDPQHVLAWTRYKGKNGFYLFKDKTRDVQWIGKEKMPQNGHNTYVPHTNNEWVLNDTYPQGEERLQELYLYHVPTDRKIVLGRFHEPRKFSGEWRCDLHPRCNQQGTKVFFDSTHGGNGRQIYMIDIEKIVRG